MVIVYRAFSAHFCTVFVARLLLSDFRSERSWRNKPLKVTNMATSKMKIKKVCEWCGTTFYAQKLTTRFCSHRCNNLAYKEAVRQKRIQEIETKVQTVISEQPISYFKDKEYLSFKEVATLLGLSKQAVYKMVYATL